MNNLPKISIVTPCLNQGKYLEKTILSVIGQQYPNLEYFIEDGGSTDGCIDIIKKYEKHLTGWRSEPDNGQSHAINKGLERATGDIFNWVNSDDLLAPGSLWKVAKEFMENPNTTVICGRYTAFSKKKQIRNLRMKVFTTLENTLIFGYVSPCCMFWKMKIVKELGGFDERLQHVFDLEFWWRFLEKKGLHQFRFIENNLTFFRLHPESKTIGNHQQSKIERHNLQRSALESFVPEDSWLERLNEIPIPVTYSRKWEFPEFNPEIFIKYSKADMLMCNPLCFSYTNFYSLYFKCLFSASFPSLWAAFLTPFRRIYRKLRPVNSLS